MNRLEINVGHLRFEAAWVGDAPRTTEVIRGLLPLRSRLIHCIADAWSEITGAARDELSIFLYEVPGANCFEYGSILPEASQDHGAVTG